MQRINKLNKGGYVKHLQGSTEFRGNVCYLHTFEIITISRFALLRTLIQYDKGIEPALSKTYKYQINDKISDLICRLSTNILYVPYNRKKLVEISQCDMTALPISLDKSTKYIYIFAFAGIKRYASRKSQARIKHVAYRRSRLFLT